MKQSQNSSFQRNSYQTLLRKKRNKSVSDTKVENIFRIARQQLDLILMELGKQYNCQWNVISTALLRDHGIKMSEQSIRDRYTTYLDPLIKRQSYTKQQAYQVARFFWVKGRTYSQIKNAFGSHGRGSIKKCLCLMARRGIKNLQMYILGQKTCLNQNFQLINGYIKRFNLMDSICSEGCFKWSIYQHTYTLLYYFMVNQPKQFNKIPKQLALLLYKRLAEMSESRQNQKRSFYNKICPRLYQQIQENWDNKRKKYRETQQNFELNHILINQNHVNARRLDEQQYSQLSLLENQNQIGDKSISIRNISSLQQKVQ